MKKKKAAKAENHERWLLTYADLITLLLVFFIVLYAGSQEDSKKFAILAEGLRSGFNNISNEGGGGNSPVFLGSGSTSAGGQGSELADFESIRSAVQRAALDRGIADRVTVRMEPDRIVIGITGDVLFGAGGSLIRPSAEPVLDAVANTLKGKPNEIRVEGHTDNVPINTPDYNSNWELSSARATAVLRALVARGLPADKLFAAAYGDTRPKADNATAEGRSQNRRAEIVVLYPQSTAAPAPTPVTR